MFNLLKTSSTEPVRILVPAIGTGRVVKDFLQCDELPTITLHAVEPDQHKLEPDEEEKTKFKEQLESTEWKKCDVSGPDRYERSGSSIVIYNQHIETFLEEDRGFESYDAIFCFLFFHYIPHCFISVLQALYDLLSEDGLFVVDELQGSDTDNQELLRCIDLHVDEFSSLSDYNEDCRAWKDFHLERLQKEAAFWGSAVKATQPDIVLETLRPLFDRYKTAKSRPDDYSLTKNHLPWMWAHRQGKYAFDSWEESLKDTFNSLERDLNAQFEVHFFKSKKKVGNKYQKWKKAKLKSRVRINKGIDSILWRLDKNSNLNHNKVVHMTNHVIPAVVMQLVASSGIFDYRNRITSAFLATGSSPWAPQDTTLEGLHILNNPSYKTESKREEEFEKQAKYWSINYHIFANILKRPLSSGFINSGKRFALGARGSMEKDLLHEEEFESISVPTVNVGNVDSLDISPPETQVLLSLNLLSIDRASSSNVELEQNRKDVIKEWVYSIPKKVEDDDKDELEQDIQEINEKLTDRKKQSNLRRGIGDFLSLNLLIQKFGTILFLPIPGYLEESDGKNEVGAVFGLGLTVRSIEEDTIGEVEGVLQLSKSLIQRFHDKYLSLKWIDDARGAALRSAISTIMARNFAHNIGSHVAINASNQNIKSRIQNLYDHIDLSRRPVESGGSEKIQCYLEVVEWLDYVTEKLNEYQIHRNEYLANFTNQSPVPTKFYRDLVLDFTENTLLMDNIAKSEGVCFEEDGPSVQNRLKIRTYINGEEVQCRYPSAVEIGGGSSDDLSYPDSFPYLIKAEGDEAVDAAFNDKEVEWVNPAIEKDPDIEVILSNPHAFYSILENFIRNSAKHNEDTLQGSNGQKEDLEVYISVEEDGSSYCVTIHDSVSVVDLQSEEDDSQSAKGFQKAVETTLLDDYSNPRQENSGIADMKVNAFLLSTPAEALSDGSLTEKMDVVVCSEDCDSPAVREFKMLRGRDEEGYDELIREVGESAYFGYQFRLPKPKKICWVGSVDTRDEETLDQLTAAGVTFHESAQDYFGESREQSLASYDFAVIREEAIWDWLEETGEDDDIEARLDELLLALPCRAIVVEADEGGRPPVLQDAKDLRRVQVVTEDRLLDFDGDDSTVDRLLRNCWHVWLGRWDVNHDKKAQAYIYTDNVEGWSDEHGDVGPKHEENIGPVNLTVTSYNGDENEPRLDPPEEGRLVTYERHGGLHKVFDSEEYREEIAPRLQKKEAANTFDKNSADFAQINYPPKNSAQRELLTYKLVEAGLLRVLVVDERLAGLSEQKKHDSLDYVFRTAEDDMTEEAKTPKGKDYRFWHQAAAANVYLVTHLEVGEGAGLSIGQNAERLSLRLNDGNGASVSYQDEEIEGEKPSDFDVVIVHRTLFIKMRNRLRRENKDEKKSSKRLVKLLRQCAPFVVINSGGGEPHGIDKSTPYRFISYSKLSKCLSGNVSGNVIAKAKLSNHLLTLIKDEAFS